MTARTLDADLCVIGAGPAGLAVAGTAAAAGRRVLLVDAGGRAPATMGEGRVAATDDVAESSPTLLPGPPLHREAHVRKRRARTLGGSSTLWIVRPSLDGEPTLRLVRPDDADLTDGPGSDGWPSPTELSTHLDHAERWFGLVDPSWGPVEHPAALPFDPDVFSARREYFAEARIVHEHRVRELEALEQVELMLETRMVELHSEAGRCHEVVLAGPGATTRVRPRDVVLAAGGIENSRQLLLARHTGAVPDPHDVVGRWFTDHPHVVVGSLLASDAPERFGAFHDFHRDGDDLALGHHVTTPAARRTAGLPPMSAVAYGVDAPIHREALAAWRGLTGDRRRQQTPAGLAREVLRLARHPRDAVRLGSRRLRNQPPHHPGRGGWGSDDTRLGRVDRLEIEAMVAQTPSPEVRVALDDRTDDLGRPTPLLRWAWHADDVRSYWRVVDVVSEQLRSAGVGQVVPPDETPGAAPHANTGFHHMGGTRMASDASDGVVDLDGRHHQVENLWVAGSSVFPDSGGWANPTLLLVALSLRLGEKLGRTR